MSASPFPANRSALIAEVEGMVSLLGKIRLAQLAAVEGDEAKLWVSVIDVFKHAHVVAPRIESLLQRLKDAAQASVPHGPGVSGLRQAQQPVSVPVAANDAHPSAPEPEQPGPQVA